MHSTEVIDGIAASVGDEFRESRRILSFEGYLDLFAESPYSLARSAVQYVADMVEHFGEAEIEDSPGVPRRHLLFDQEFRDGVGRVHSQELVQEQVYRLCRAFADRGRAEKMILLTGPNGSGKSVIVEAIFRGLEQYSRLPEGARYRFNWIFPRSEVTSGGLGFTPRRPEHGEGESYAQLEGEEIAALLSCELKDHPLFLVPRAERHRLLQQVLEGSPADREQSFEYLLDGELCGKCKRIYEGLLSAYQGDWHRVVQHVQVVRYYFSQRFREGAVTILPVGSIDAQEQQITADLSTQNLPPVLQNLKLFEPVGDLVDANGGVVEYGDFLKRPMDFNKYLLNAIEKGTISLPNTLTHLNLVMLGTSNEKHLDAFKTTPEWTSFKGRIELVAVPYILEYRREAELYRDMMRAVTKSVHVAPHTFELAALWAVLTRLLRPDLDSLSGRLKEIAATLTPLEKAWLYDHREAPARLDRDDQKVLLAGAKKLRSQYRESPIYEGRFGASAREMHMVLTQASYDRKTSCLTPSLVFKWIRELIRDRTVYDFLKLKPSEGYHDAEAFVKAVSEHYSLLLLDELHDAMELISEREYDQRFDRYFLHVVAFTKSEKVPNPQTGALESPSEQIMQAVEELLDIDEPAEKLRQDLVARIGAYAVDHPGEQVDFRELFPDLLRAVKKRFYEERRDRVTSLIDDLLLRDTDEFPRLSDERRSLVSTVTANLEARGYCASCSHDAAAFLKAHFPSE